MGGALQYPTQPGTRTQWNAIGERDVGGAFEPVGQGGSVCREVKTQSYQFIGFGYRVGLGTVCREVKTQSQQRLPPGSDKRPRGGGAGGGSESESESESRGESGLTQTHSQDTPPAGTATHTPRKRTALRYSGPRPPPSRPPQAPEAPGHKQQLQQLPHWRCPLALLAEAILIIIVLTATKALLMPLRCF